MGAPTTRQSASIVSKNAADEECGGRNGGIPGQAERVEAIEHRERRSGNDFDDVDLFARSRGGERASGGLLEREDARA